MIKNVISVIDGEAGSCGKAKVVGEIATDKSIRLGAAITNCMPNAGHTYLSKYNTKKIFRNIPVSVVNPKTELFIGPGSAIDMEVFIKEYESVKWYLNGRKIYVHEMVPLIEERHKERERANIKSGSTFKGCGAVTQDKVIRDKELKFFMGYKNAIKVSNDEWFERLYDHLDNSLEYVIMEGAQGCDLDLNHSGNYPYVTSRNVSTAQLLADCGISPERLLETIMVIRPFPIRISNIATTGEYNYTGNYGSGSQLTWSQINISSSIGSYPFIGDINILDINMDLEYIKYLMDNVPEVYLRQLFGDSYNIKGLDDVTPLEALELERLYNKSLNIGCYVSKILMTPINRNIFKGAVISDLSEQTTVTKMERRVFDMDIEKVKNNCRINTPYGLYLNFFQHLDKDFVNLSGNYYDFYYSKYIRNYLDWLENETNTPILALGTGAMNGIRILKRSLVKEIEK